MTEETVTVVRYHPILKREVLVRLTYTVGEGPRPDLVRRFLIREEVLGPQDSQGSVCEGDVSPAGLTPE